MDDKDKISDLINQLAQARHDELNAYGIGRNCVSCQYFNVDNEQCKKHEARPPATVIIRGCSDYIPDVPF